MKESFKNILLVSISGFIVGLILLVSSFQFGLDCWSDYGIPCILNIPLVILICLSSLLFLGARKYIKLRSGTTLSVVFLISSCATYFGLGYLIVNSIQIL